MTTIISAEDRGNPVEIQFDAAQAAAPIRWRIAGEDEWSSTPYQTADAGRRDDEAVRLVLEWLQELTA